jgi:dTDP-4-amino-4,6-dideoxygalactose transaminase
MTIRFLDLGRLHDTIRPELNCAYERILSTNRFVDAATSEVFEAQFARAHAQADAAGCASGTDALSLALRAAGVGSGDEVIVPAMTFVATAEAVVHAGAVPVIVDVDDETLLLSAEAVASARTSNTVAIVPVDLYGHVVPFETLQSWRDDGLIVVSDAAQAHLASWGGRMVGASADAACFSFYPGKNLGALGDAGIVTSNDRALIDRVKSIRDHGRSDHYRHEEIGWSSRLDGLQAAFLEVKLRHLPLWTECRRRLAEEYRKSLDELFDHGVSLVPWTGGAVHHLLVVRVPGYLRDTVRSRLAEAGVETGLHYPIPLSLQPALRKWHRACPAAEDAATELISLPMDPLMTVEEVNVVCNELARAVETTDRRDYPNTTLRHLRR